MTVTARTVTKELIGLEDILTGSGSVAQTRNGTAYSMTRINADNLSYDGGESIRDKLAKKFEVVTSIANLRLLDTSVESERYVNLIGYYAEGDGNSGLFYWDAASTATDNGGTIIKVTAIAIGRWMRNTPGYITAKDFGSRGITGIDDYTAITNAVAYLKSINGGGLWFTSATDGYETSNTIDIDFGNISLRLDADIKLTKTTKSSALHIHGIDSNNMLEKVSIQSNTRAVINGNGSSITGYTYNISDTQYSSILLEYIDNYNVFGVHAKNGLVSSFKAYRCSNGYIDNTYFSGSIHDNGCAITRDSSNYDADDATTWANTTVINSKSFDNEDFGFTAFDASEVIFNNCLAWGNGTESSHLSVPGGGGFSYEDDNVSPGVKSYHGQFINCRSPYGKGNGFFITGNGIYVDEKCKGNKTTTTWAGANPDLYANGIILLDAQDVTVLGEFKGNDRNGMHGRGITAGSYLKLEIGGSFSGNGYEGIELLGIEEIVLLDSLRTDGNGVTTNDSNAIDINNGSFNTGVGILRSNGGYHINSPDSVIVATQISKAIIKQIAGENNSLQTANAPIICRNMDDASIDGVFLPSSSAPGYVASIENTVTNGAIRNIEGDATTLRYLNAATNKIALVEDVAAATGWADSTAQTKFNLLLDELEDAGILNKV